MSDLLPHLAEVADELAVVRSMHSHVFNHDPAVNYLNTGHERVGRPTMGAWLSYGLGAENKDLPAFVVLTSGVKLQPLLDNYWSSGFLPAEHQGVEFRPSGDPVLHLQPPEGMTPQRRRRELDMLRWMNERHHREFGDPEILARIRQYELAFRMQTAVPELADSVEGGRTRIWTPLSAPVRPVVCAGTPPALAAWPCEGASSGPLAPDLVVAAPLRLVPTPAPCFSC